MSDTFTTWRRADEQWAEKHAPLFEIVFRQFLESGEWPSLTALQRFLHQSSIRSVDVRAVLRSKPALPGQLIAPLQETFILGCRHLLALPEARGLLDLTVRATQIAVRKYLTHGVADSDMVVTSDEPEIQTFMPPTIERFYPFITSDHPNAFAGGGYRPGEYWSMNIGQDVVWRFEGISSPWDYVERQLDLVREWAEEQDNRIGVTAAPKGPRKAFVVMPFDEAWSDTSFSFIMKAVAAQDGALEATRADRIEQTGRITDQIVEALLGCDFVIADITGNNVNVGWELGYAYAHQKPCVIIMQNGEAAPFDIYDHRRVDYSPTPTADEDDRLAAILRNTIGT
jgi:Nucleoside 2-deoxyribosyltransferase